MKNANQLDLIKVLPQYLLPLHLISRVTGYFTHKPLGKATPWLIKQFIRYYGVDMSIAGEPHEYATFNEFFTRALKPEARPLADSGILCPVDGAISQIGRINEGLLLQAKGRYYNLVELFGGFKHLAGLFEDGIFCTIYLSPKDYHRIHMPISGRPIDMIYVPGRLFSVNQSTARGMPNLFARNERVLSMFKTKIGPMALIMVGAINVGSIETVWEDVITPSNIKKPLHWHPPDATPALTRGVEMGRFNLGSTVILLFQADRAAWLPELAEGAKVLMGQALGTPLKNK